MKRTAFLVVLLLSACNPDEQKPTLNLDSATKITEKFETRATFVPPPRTVMDIIQTLDVARPDVTTVAILRSQADAEAPDISGKPLVEFYYRRADAASGIGRVDQYLADTRKAYELAQDMKRTDLYAGILLRRARAEALTGNYENSKALWVERVDLFANNRGYQFTAFASLVQLEGNAGNLQQARMYMRQLENLYHASMRWGDWDIHGSSREETVETARADLAIVEGRYVEAEAALRRAIAANARSLASWDKLPANQRQSRGTYKASRDFYLRTLAEVLAQQGRLVEAEIESRNALTNRLQESGKASPTTAFALDVLARVLLEQGRYAEAETVARRALDSLSLAGVPDNSRYVGRPMVALTAALLAQTYYAEALSVYAKLTKAFENDEGARRQFVSSTPDIGLALLSVGQATDAQTMLSSILDDMRSRYGEKHLNTAEVRGLRAVAIGNTNAGADALPEFKATADILLAASRQIETDSTPAVIRAKRKQVILEGYIDTLAFAAKFDGADKAGLTEESFRIADAIRGQAVQGAIAASSARARVNDPVLADLIRREQDAKARIGALYGLLVNLQNAPADQRDPQALKNLPVDIDQLRTARAAIREEIERRFPDYASLIDLKPATVAQVRASLRDGEAMISVYVGETKSYVWAVPKSGPVAFAAVPQRSAELAKTVADIRRSLDPQAETISDVPAFKIADAHRLYKSFLEPVKAGWSEASNLLVVSHGPLAQLPFAVLPMELAADRPTAMFSEYKGTPWLIRKAAITQLPSVSTLTALRALPAGKQGRDNFIGIGDPIFAPDPEPTKIVVGGVNTRGILKRRNAPTTAQVSSAELAQLPRLPETADEVRSIATALNADLTRDVLLGRQASETIVKSGALAGRKVIVFATHGLVPGDLNGLTQPALALTAPALADGKGDGLLTMEEILGLKIDADWVVLSACNTASGDGAGAEAVSGLGRAFFYAGARALLVSNWPVETTSAQMLTTDLFRRQAEKPTLGRSQALREAMLALIDTMAPEGYSYAHPIFWAPFSVIGDGG